MLKHDYAYGDGVALTIFQKVMILERISFFSRIEEEVLSKIASSLEEVEAKSGETIIEKPACQRVSVFQETFWGRRNMAQQQMALLMP